MRSKLTRNFSKDELSSEIWFLDGDTYKMKPEIRQALLDVVENYVDFTDLELDIEK